jgi:hypothetical protein
MEATESLIYPYLTTRVTSPSRVVLEVFKFSPSDGALIPLEGPIRRTGEGGSEWEPIKILLEGDRDPTRRTQLPTHVSDPLPKLAKSTQPLKCYWT